MGEANKLASQVFTGNLADAWPEASDGDDAKLEIDEHHPEVKELLNPTERDDGVF